jgi:hypothetical protein
MPICYIQKGQNKQVHVCRSFGIICAGVTWNNLWYNPGNTYSMIVSVFS